MIASNIQNLPNRFFQPALSRVVGVIADDVARLKSDKLLYLVTDIDDVNQCIDIIINTPKGSDPHRPTFGCDAWKWIDAPITDARPHFVREITDSIRQWEPRVDVVKIEVAAISKDDPAHLNVTVSWRLMSDAVLDIYVTNIAFGDNSDNSDSMGFGGGLQ